MMNVTSIGFAYNAGDSMRTKVREAKTMEGKSVSVTIRVPDDVYTVISKLGREDIRSTAEVARLFMLRGYGLWKRDHLLYDLAEDGGEAEVPTTVPREEKAMASTHEIKWFSLNNLRRFEYILLRKALDICRSKLKPESCAGIRAIVNSLHENLPASEKTINLEDHPKRVLS